MSANLETFSFHAMNSATLVYAGAMVAFAYDFAFSARIDGAVDRASERTSASAKEPAKELAKESASVGAAAAAPPTPPTPADLSAKSMSMRIESTDNSEVRSKAAGIAVSLTILAFGIHFVAVATRGYSAGRVPWGNMYEFSTAAALAVVAAFLVLLPRFGLRWLGLFVITPVLLTLGVATTLLYKPGTEALVPALHSYWLAVHVTAAVIASGIFTVAAAITVLYLVADNAERRVARGDGPGAGGYVLDRVPTAARLDKLAFRTIAFAFPIWTFAVVAGAIWAEDAWGRYWGWDPKETWAFITWVVYACYLHARVTAGWKGRRAAIIALLGFACFLFNYFGVNILIPGLHSYSGL